MTNIKRISVDSAGLEANEWSGDPSISADGRFITYETDATNLVAGDDNLRPDIIVHDTETSQTTRVSVDSTGLESASGSSYDASISGDGRYVTFESSAADLTANDANGDVDVFIHDRMLGTTSLVSADPNGVTQANAGSGNSYYGDISGNGRFVAFASGASNLLDADRVSANTADIYLRDVISGTTTVVSAPYWNPDGTGGYVSSLASVSADGRYVVFESNSGVFVDELANNPSYNTYVFLRDTFAETTTLLSTGEGFSGASDPVISEDGDYVVFMRSYNGSPPQIFRHNIQTGVNEGVSADGNGDFLFGTNRRPDISADGRYIVFTSNEAVFGTYQIYVKDMLTGDLNMVSTSNEGIAGNGTSFVSAISADGSTITFESMASNLVADDTNDTSDVFSVANPLHEDAPANAAPTWLDITGFEGVTDDGLPLDFASNIGDVVDFYLADYAIDPDGDRLSFSVNALPSGLSFDPFTTRISGTLTGEDGSDFASFSYGVDDGNGHTVSRGTFWYVPQDELKSADELFDDAYFLTMAQFAYAAYELGDWEPRKNIVNYSLDNSHQDFNIYNPVASGQTRQLEDAGWQLLDHVDLGLNNVVSNEYVYENGATLESGFVSQFDNGIFTNENAAALIARSSDALVISFRGTNDGAVLALSNGVDTYDRDDWIGKSDYYEHFRPLIQNAIFYANDQGLQQIYITGHSLGAAMVEAFMIEHKDETTGSNLISFDAVAFASPGYAALSTNDDPIDQERLQSFWNENDAIVNIFSTGLTDNIGDFNEIFYPQLTSSDPENEGSTQHEMLIYRGVLELMRESGASDYLLWEGPDGGKLDNIVTHFDLTGNIGGADPISGDIIYRDTFSIAKGEDTLVGHQTDDELFLAGDSNDSVYDKRGDDVVFLGEGDDYVRVGGGADTYHGGAGKDYISYYDSTFGVEIDLANNTVDNSWAYNDVISGFESFSGSNSSEYGDTAYGTDGSNTIRTYGGDDRVFARGGSDKVELGAGDDYVRVGGGEEEFHGGSGKDYISYYDSKGGVFINLATNKVSGSWAVNDTISGFESVSGSKDGDDTIYGTDGSNTIKTYGGHDKVYAGSGTDKIELGEGDDYVQVGGGNETFYGGDGDDYISYINSSNGVKIDLEADTVSGSWAFNDTIKDFENASGSRTGNDKMYGTDGANRLRGYDGDDKLYGRAGSDELYGGDGEDLLDGGAGEAVDYLWGGGDADEFHFDRGEGRDIIKDFENNIDTLSLDNFSLSKTQVLDIADQVGSDVFLDFGSDGLIIIENLTIGQLSNDLDMV